MMLNTISISFGMLTERAAFLINHSPEYHAAHLSAILEFLFEYFIGFKSTLTAISPALRVVQVLGLFC